MKDLTISLLPQAKYICLIIVLASLFYYQPSLAIESRKIEKMIEEAPLPGGKEVPLQESHKLLKQGRKYYYKFCVHCHGQKGKGDGRASYHLFPAPRELSLGIFKFHSTRTNTLPLDEDLVRTISKGVPGTAMPAWGEVLSDEAIRSLVEFIKTFSHRFSMELPGRKMPVSMEPPFDNLSVTHGKKLYSQLRCGRCHGEDGGKEGKLSGTLKNFWSNPSFVYDLRRETTYKAGSSGTDIHRSLLTGLDGSPMNAYDYLSNSERWNLVHFLQSRFINQNQKPISAVTKVISKKISSPIGLRMDDSIWEQGQAVSVSLIPVRARKNPIHRLTVKSLHNENRIAIRLEWDDPTPDGISNNKFIDQSAIQFALGSAGLLDSPFYGMGEKERPVNIWHWKADVRQKIIQSDKPENNRSGIKLNSKAGMFLSPFNESSVEELNSRGIGTLTVQSLKDQQVEGMGHWENGRWSVVFIRKLQAVGTWDVDFADKDQVLLAFALWDGNNKDMNANKLVSFWQILDLR